jgi:hypothetical protein
MLRVFTGDQIIKMLQDVNHFEGTHHSQQLQAEFLKEGFCQPTFSVCSDG